MNAKENANFIVLSEEDTVLLQKLDKEKTRNAIRAYMALCDLFLLSDFRSWVKKTRRAIKVPTAGYSNDVVLMNATAYNLRTGEELRDGKGLVNKTEKLAFDYIITKAYFNKLKSDRDYLADLLRIMREYVIFNDVKENAVSSGDISYEKVDGFNDRIRISVRADIRQDELRDFINDRWFLISEYSKVIGPDRSSQKSKLKKHEDFLGSVRTYNENLKMVSTPSLRDKRDGYSSITLSRKLNKTPDSIRKTIERMGTRIAEVNA